MKINNHFIQLIYFLQSFLSWILLPAFTILFVVFSTNTFGQVVIPFSYLNSEFPKNSESYESKITNISHGGQNIVLTVFNDQLYVLKNYSLWVLSKDGKFSKVESVEGGVNSIVPFGDQLLVGTYDEGLLILGKDKRVRQLQSVRGSVNNISLFGDRFLVSTNENLKKRNYESDFWIVSKNENVIKVPDFNKSNSITTVFSDSFFVLNNNLPTSDEIDSWIVSKDGSAGKIENIIDGIYFIELFDDKIFGSGKEGLWTISKDGKANRVVGVEGEVGRIKTFGEHLLFNIPEGLMILEKDGKISKVENFEGRIYEFETFGSQLLIGTDNGLWTISKDTKANKFESIQGEVDEIEGFDDQIFIGAGEDLWIINNNGKANKVENVEGNVRSINSLNNQYFITTYKTDGKDNLWLLNKEGIVSKIESVNDTAHDFEQLGKHIYFVESDTLQQLDPNVTIKTNLVPNSWWAKIISHIPNWLSMERVEVKAYYSDENGRDPYNQSVPREFRFAKAKGNNIPSDDEFSSINEPFYYEIGWGSQDVQYWVKDKWGNTFKTKENNIYRGIPSQFFAGILIFILPPFFILGCFALAPKVGFCHSAIMNPWLRKYFSLGSVPLLVSVFPSLRRYILRRYSDSVSKDKEFTQWKTRFVSPNEDFLPENFGKKLNDEKRLLLTGQSGIGKTVFFKHLTATYVSENKPPLPAKVFPVYIPLTNYGGNSLEDLVYNQLFAYGKITDKELAPMFLEQGGLLIFLDGVNEVQNVADRQKLSEFVEKYWTSNYICLSSQQSYPEIENVPKVELKTFSAENVREFIRNRVEDKEKAEKVIESLSSEDYKLYSVPRDLEIAIAILKEGKENLPKSRTELYKTVFSSIFAKWKDTGNTDAEDILCERAYTMIATRDLAFDLVDNPEFKEITTDLFEQKFLIKREKNYNFRHDLIRSYLASEYFYPRWQNLFAKLDGKKIDSNWLEMLKFSCENINDSNEIKSLVYAVLEKSIRKDLVKDLVIWLKNNHPNKCKSWEKEFYTKYGELDFKPQIKEDNKMKKILFVMANPQETTRLRLDKEFREVKEGLKLSKHRDQFELKISTATRPKDLRRDMLDYEPQFVHFSGHGETEGIVLENENGNAQIVETSALADLFSLFTEFTECVVLNSCFSENQAKAIRKHIPFVVGMNKAVPDDAAIEFSIGFYDAIGSGRNVEDAFKFGKNAIDFEGIEGSDIQVLMKK